MQLERDWATFKAHNLKATAGAEMVIVTKRSFMAGAFCLLQMIEGATGSASDEERIEFEAARLREWVKREADASTRGNTTIPPSEWGNDGI